MNIFSKWFGLNNRRLLTILQIILLVINFGTIGFLSANLIKSYHTINMAGSQRWYTQQIKSLTYDISQGSTNSDLEATFADTIDNLEIRHNALVHQQVSGDLERPIPPPPSVKKILFEEPYNLEFKLDSFIEVAKQIKTDLLMDVEPKSQDISYITANTAEIIKLLDLMVQRYENNFEQQTKSVIIIILLMATMSVFILILTRRQILDLETEYQDLVENAPFSIIKIQDESIIQVNRTFLKLVEIDRSDLDKYEISDFMSEEYFEDVILRNVLREQGEPSQDKFEIVITSRSGETIPVQLYIKNNEGKDKFIFFINDIRKQVKVQNQLRQTLNKLVELEKLELVGKLAGGISHDFNNILTVMSGHIELLLLQTDEQDEIYNDLKELELSVKMASDMTQQLLTLSRRKVINNVAVEINDAILNKRQLLDRVTDSNVDLEFDLTDQPCVVEIDLTLLGQVLMNLVLNANDAITGPGTITIKTYKLTLPGKIVPSLVTQHVLIQIIDTGSGIEQDDLFKAIEPFYTTKEKGTGLGLYNVTEIVEDLGGEFSIQSKPCQGTTVGIYFPLVSEESTDTKSTDKLQQLGGPHNFLIIEDNKEVSTYIRQVLSNKGHEVEVIDHPDKILNEEMDLDQFDVILSDVMLPRMTGIELFEKLDRLKDNRVVFMSGYSRKSEDVRKILELNLVFIEKPFTPTELFNTLAEVLDKN